MNQSFCFRFRTISCCTLLIICAIACSNVTRAQVFPFGNGQDSKQAVKLAKKKFVEHFPLVVVDGVIGFEFPGNYNEANSIVGEMAAGGGSSSSSGNNTFSCSSSNQIVKAEVSNFTRAFMFAGQEPETRELASIQGLGAQYWCTQLIHRDNQTICSHIDVESQVMFQLISSPKESRLILFDGPQMVTLKGNGYFDLASQSEFQLVADRAESWGIKLPSDVHSTTFDELMLSIFSVAKSEWEDFEKDFADLAADKFQDREAATQRLKGELKQWESLVAWGLTHQSVSSETKSRLMAVIKDETSESAKRISGLISGKLLDNPEKLVDLMSLQAARDAQVIESIVERLKQLTEKDFGTDVAAWRKWADENRNLPVASRKNGQVQPEAANDDEVEAEKEAATADVTKRVSIALVREELSRLLTLHINDQDKIRIDRDRWARQFDSRKIQDLIKETQDQFTKSGLPLSWLNLGGGYDPSTIDYPQLLFAQVEESLNQQLTVATNDDINLRHMRVQRMNQFQFSGLQKSLNREFQDGQIKLRVELHPDSVNAVNRKKLPEAKYFKFSYLDEVLNDCLILDEQPEGQLSLWICRIEAGEFIGIGQDEERCWINVSTNSGSLSISDTSAKKLFQEHADELKRLLHPVLQHHGIDLTEATGGALEIKNAVLKLGNERRVFGR